MIDILNEVLAVLPTLIEDTAGWDSLAITRRKPHTFRAFYQYGDVRVCLHRFETCDTAEAFFHPHPWPGAFKILQGSYEMGVGYSRDRVSEPEVAMNVILPAGSVYEITNPNTWHYVRPLEECYTVMVNGAPWPADFAHTQVRTTKGKDLDAMTPEQLQAHFDVVRKLLGHA